MCGMKPELMYTDNTHIRKLQLIHLQSKGFLRSKTKVKEFKERIPKGEMSCRQHFTDTQKCMIYTRTSLLDYCSQKISPSPQFSHICILCGTF